VPPRRIAVIPRPLFRGRKQKALCVGSAPLCTERLLITEPRTSARGFFRGDYSPALANRIRQARISLGPRYRPLCGAGFMDGIDPWPRTSARGLFCPGGHTDTICSRPALWGQRGNPVETTLAARQLGLKQHGPRGV
jgi:hypothetical protein